MEVLVFGPSQEYSLVFYIKLKRKTELQMKAISQFLQNISLNIKPEFQTLPGPDPQACYRPTVLGLTTPNGEAADYSS